tara:strand:- start:733 stop:894 length:162 start_codon:yes stop_codon:yes gene_type:complete
MTIDELKQQLKELNERTLHIPVKAPSRQDRAKTRARGNFEGNNLNNLNNRRTK